MNLFRKSGFLLYAISLGLLGACGNEEPETVSNDVASSIEISTLEGAPSLFSNNPELDIPIRNIIRGYLQKIDSEFSNTSLVIDNLQEKTEAFISQPDAGNLELLRGEWLSAHSSYELTALHRHFAHLILDERLSLNLLQLQYQMNNWPILAGYVDYVSGYPDSGIVHDVNVDLDIPTLKQQHGVFDLAEASLGFHVMEFLLWGENIDRSSPRAITDYQEITQLSAEHIDAGLELHQLGNNRRRQMLQLVSESLVVDFNAYQASWLEGSNAFRNSLDQRNGTELLVLMIEAMTSMLTEELLVRSLYPLLNEEYAIAIPSPFSHSTQNAVSAQLSGVEQLLMDSGSSNGGTSLDVILSGLSVDFEEFFYPNFDASKECLVLLYSTLDISRSQEESVEAEFAVVECINLLTNMVDHLEQIKIGLSNPV